METRRNFFTTGLGAMFAFLLGKKNAEAEPLYTKGSLDTGTILKLFNIEDAGDIEVAQRVLDEARVVYATCTEVVREAMQEWLNSFSAFYQAYESKYGVPPERPYREHPEVLAFPAYVAQVEARAKLTRAEKAIDDARRRIEDAEDSWAACKTDAASIEGLKSLRRAKAERDAVGKLNDTCADEYDRLFAKYVADHGEGPPEDDNFEVRDPELKHWREKQKGYWAEYESARDRVTEARHVLGLTELRCPWSP